MADVVEQMTYAGRGPWLIDHQHLQVLDDIIDQQRRRIAQAKDETVKQAVEEEIQSYLKDPILCPRTRQDVDHLRAQLKHIILDQYRNVRERDNFEIDVDGRKRLSVRFFEEAFPHLSLKEKPVGFEVQLEHDETVCKLILFPGTGMLHIVAYPAENLEVQQFYSAVRDWARSIQPTRWQRLWRQLGGFAWLPCFGTLPIIFSLQQFLDKQPHRIASIQAQDLLEPGWPLALFLMGGLVSLMLAFPPPHTLLGIGQGQDQIMRWRNWMGLVSHAVSGFVVLSLIALLLPLIANFVF